jgi:N-acetylglucosamine-6-phosphate deacetylase
MKLIKCITIVFISGMIYSCSDQQENGNYVEGLSYLDEQPLRIEIEDGRIKSVAHIKELSDPQSNYYIAPGLIDNQINGFMGVSFVDTGGELTQEGISLVTTSLWEKGITSYFPTLTTNDKQIYLKNLKLLARTKEDPDLLGSIPGFHIEGPYISPVDGFRGAHPLKYVREPDWDEFMEFYEAADGNILQISLAPEIEGAMDFIKKCQEIDGVVGLAHHNGSADQISEAIDNGARLAIHLGNGLANTINRHRNPLWPQLADDRMSIGIICDGIHLLPEQIKVFYRAKGPDRIIMTSDVSSLGGMPVGKYLNAIGDTLEITQEGAIIYPAQQVLAGSAQDLSKGVGHIMEVTGCSLAEAVQMASTNAARLYGLDDRGELNPGMRADIILFTMDDFQMNIKKTIVSGNTVYDALK